ncbi:MAG: hypothetical protein WCG80_05935 [Spirochaetales bacterium]
MELALVRGSQIRLVAFTVLAAFVSNITGAVFATNSALYLLPVLRPPSFFLGVTAMGWGVGNVEPALFPLLFQPATSSSRPSGSPR